MSTTEVSFAIVSDPGTAAGNNRTSCGFYEESRAHVSSSRSLDGVGG